MTTLLDLLTPTRPTRSEPPRQWLLNHLIAAGHLTETGLTRRARLHSCDCGATILAGLDDDRCALEALVDPVPLTALGEALARIEDRWTWTLRREGPGFVLDRRLAHTIAHHPAGSQPRRDVVAEHRCGRILADPETAVTSFAEAHPNPYPAGCPAPF